MQYAALCFHAFEQAGAGIGREYMKGAGGKCIFYCPVHRTVKYMPVVLIQPEYKAAIDHYTKGVEALYGLFVILAQILFFVALHQVALAKCFKAYKYAAHTGLCCFFN